MKTESDIRVFRTLLSVVSSLVLLYLVITGWKNQATVLIIYIIFVAGYVVYYLTRETVADKKRAVAKKNAPPAVVHVNLFEKAIERNETREFVLGKGEYYLPEKTADGFTRHSPASSFQHIKGYALRYGADVMLQQFWKALDTALAENLHELEARLVVKYVVLYSDECSKPDAQFIKSTVPRETHELIMVQIDKFSPTPEEKEGFGI